MIKANELKKGNAFGFYKPLEQELQIGIVKGLYFNEDEGLYFVQSEQYADINLNGIKPIPLTPEILEKFGFEKNNGRSIEINKFWLIGYEAAVKLNTEIIDCIFLQTERQVGFSYVCERIEFTHIKYLHQFQNLLYDFTGKELEINLHVDSTI